MSDNEYLRLPHGMFDREEEWIKRERNILDLHAKSGEKIGCKLKKYSPLGYSSTFIRGANTAKDKVYTLNSKSGKSLILSCDSTPSVFRNYVTSSNGEPQRIAFVAPLFRYRNSNSRHFTQLGYSMINEKPSGDESLDINLIQLAKSMTDLFDANGIKMKIHINDYGALRNILSKYVSEDELPELLHTLQFSSKEERIQIFQQLIRDKNLCNQLVDLFSQEPRIIRYSDKKENQMKLPEEYMKIYKMPEGLNYITGVDVYFDPSDLHSIETIDTFALRFRTLQGVPLGDGGEYSRYARKWNEKINNFWSVASGVEAIERNSPQQLIEDIKRKIAICSIDASPNFVLKVMKSLENMGENVAYKGNIKNVGKAIKKIKDDYTHIAVLGSNEENGQDIRIKSLNSNDSLIIESPNKGINLNLEQDESER